MAVINPEADVTLRAGQYANTNYSGDMTLGTSFGNESEDAWRKSILRYDLTAVTGVLSATLRFTLATATTSGQFNFGVYGSKPAFEDAWVEDQVTWTSKGGHDPNNEYGGFTPIHATYLGIFSGNNKAIDTQLSFTSTPLIDWLNTRLGGLATIFLVIDNGGQSSVINFHSGENATKKPELEHEATPAPPASYAKLAIAKVVTQPVIDSEVT